MCQAVSVVGNNSSFRSKCGFTILELLIIITIVGIIAGMAYPSFEGLIRGSQLRSSASYMALALKLTRSSAVKFNDRITMCRSLNGATCNTQPGYWEEGWIIFHDSQISGTLGVVDAGEAIIRIYPSFKPGVSLRSGGNISNYISFLSSGVARGHNNVLGNGTFRVCDQRGNDSAIAVIINNTGRIRTAKGTAVCP
jgi:type IV fimbrial biogenesis protein FimT